MEHQNDLEYNAIIILLSYDHNITVITTTTKSPVGFSRLFDSWINRFTMYNGTYIRKAVEVECRRKRTGMNEGVDRQTKIVGLGLAMNMFCRLRLLQYCRYR